MSLAGALGRYGLQPVISMMLATARRCTARGRALGGVFGGLDGSNSLCFSDSNIIGNLGDVCCFQTCGLEPFLWDRDPKYVGFMDLSWLIF